MEQNTDFGWTEIFISIGFAVVMTVISIIMGYLKSKINDI